MACFVVEGDSFVVVVAACFLVAGYAEAEACLSAAGNFVAVADSVCQ